MLILFLLLNTTRVTQSVKRGGHYVSSVVGQVMNLNLDLLICTHVCKCSAESSRKHKLEKSRLLFMYVAKQMKSPVCTNKNIN